MRIPEFKNTNEALQYGEEIKCDKKLIRKLKKESKRVTRRFKKLMQQDNLKDAIYLASGQKQFVREALEEIEKMEDQEKILIGKRLICVRN